MFSPVGTIAGAVVGSLVFIVIVCIVIAIVCKKVYHKGTVVNPIHSTPTTVHTVSTVPVYSAPPNLNTNTNGPGGAPYPGGNPSSVRPPYPGADPPEYRIQT